MLVVRYIIEIMKFLRRRFQPKYYLINIRFGDIKPFYSLDEWGRQKSKRIRENPLPPKNAYPWNKLRKSLTQFGYIPSIVTYQYKDKSDVRYRLIDGNHRYHVLSETYKKADSIKVWVCREKTKRYEFIHNKGSILMQQKKDALDKLTQHRDKIRRKHPIYWKLKNRR